MSLYPITRNQYLFKVGPVLLLALVLWSVAVSRIVHAQSPSGNDTLTVEVWTNGRWRVVGRPAFNEFAAEQQLALPGLLLPGDPLRVRVTHNGRTAAHLDTILLNGRPPIQIDGAAETTALALRKLAAPNLDLIDLSGKQLTFTFNRPQQALNRLSLVARIEPAQIGATPFQFPKANYYQTITPDAAFYTYLWDSRPGVLTIDGQLLAETLGQPFFKEFSRPGSGHPAVYTYGWVYNNDDTLYVAIDFAPDNTFDGDKDYAKVYVNSPAGLKVFKASAPEQQWGRPGFVYTPYAHYQHKIYEFAIPVSALGLNKLTPGDPLPLAFAAYGTASLPPNEYPGILDPTFGTDGVTVTNYGNYARFNDVALQDDGKIVAVGTTEVSSDDNFALARYTITGTLDSTFGTNGITITKIGGNDIAYALALQTDGKIVVAGRSDDRFALARYTITGTLDSDFGTGGIVTTPFSNGASGNDVAIQPDGNIVVAGSSNNNFALARYTITGTLDNTFGAGGVITTDLGGNDVAYGLALQPDGNIVVAGRTSGANYDFALARYTITGTLDSDFGTNGITTTGFRGNDTAYGLVLQPDGKIVAVGQTRNNFALARYTGSGGLDNTFDSDGKVTTDFGSDETGRAVALQPDGKIVAVGHTDGRRLSVARYNPDGSLDNTFGTQGRANNPLGGSGYDHGYAVAIQPDRKIIAAGSDGDNFVVARYMTNDYLAITKSVELANNPAIPGEPITYTIVVANNGNDDASNVTVQDTLPANLSGDNLNQTVTITAGEALTFTISATILDVAANYTATITNTASYSYTFGSGNDMVGFITISDTVAPTFEAGSLITPTGTISYTRRPVFQWKVATDTGSGVAYYTLKATSSNNDVSLQEATTTVTATQTSYTPTVDLDNGVYTWTVKAHDVVGNVSDYVTPLLTFTLSASSSVYLPIVIKNN